MIPGVIQEFLEVATVGMAATRDKQLKPALHRINGWRLGSDKKTMSCLVPTAYTGKLIENLEDNGRFAATMEEIGPHETYQFKGRYLDSRPVSEEDMRLYQEISDKFAKAVGKVFGLPVDLGKAFMQPPEIAILFEIEEIYLQTPGPGAGRRIYPPPEVP